MLRTDPRNFWWSSRIHSCGGTVNPERGLPYHSDPQRKIIFPCPEKPISVLGFALAPREGSALPPSPSAAETRFALALGDAAGKSGREMRSRGGKRGAGRGIAASGPGDRERQTEASSRLDVEHEWRGREVRTDTLAVAADRRTPQRKRQQGTRQRTRTSVTRSTAAATAAAAAAQRRRQEGPAQTQTGWDTGTIAERRAHAPVRSDGRRQPRPDPPEGNPEKPSVLREEYLRPLEVDPGPDRVARCERWAVVVAPT